MEAKTWQETRILKDEVTFCNKDMNEQAEITWKARDQEIAEAEKRLEVLWDWCQKALDYREKETAEAHKAGMQKVAKFIDNLENYRKGYLDVPKWQAFKKENGLK